LTASGPRNNASFPYGSRREPSSEQVVGFTSDPSSGGAFRSRLRLLLVAVLLFSFAACSHRAHIRIGVVVATMQETGYFSMRQALTKRADLDGVEVIWVSSENNVAEQRFDNEAALAHGIDIPIFQPKCSTTGKN